MGTTCRSSAARSFPGFLPASPLTAHGFQTGVCWAVTDKPELWLCSLSSSCWLLQVTVEILSGSSSSSGPFCRQTQVDGSSLPGSLGAEPCEGEACSQPFLGTAGCPPGGVQRDTKPSLHQALISLSGHFLACGQEGEGSARQRGPRASGLWVWLPHHLSSWCCVYSPSNRILLSLLELSIKRTHQSSTASGLQGLLCRAMLLLLASAPHFPSSACLERLVFTMPCPSFGFCWWDLLILGDQNFPYKTLQCFQELPCCLHAGPNPHRGPVAAVVPVLVSC